MIVILAGAGASKAVSADRYPTTLEFFEQLPETVTRNRYFGLLLQFLRRVEGEESVIDIEKVLWALAELREFVQQAGSAETVAGWFVDGNRLSQPLGGKPNLAPMKEAASQADPLLRVLQEEIYKQVYDLYSSLPNEGELNDNWLSLLQPALATGERVEIFTTNYDLVIEAAVEELARKKKLPNIDTGRRGTLQPYLDDDIWAPKPGITAVGEGDGGLLTKLHGSVDWSRGEARIYVGEPLFKGEHERHVIVYPGFKGVPTEPPFTYFHSHFEATVGSADKLVFVGYAFRDGHINELLKRSIGYRARVAVINPAADLPGLPFEEEKIVHLKGHFDRTIVLEALGELGIDAGT